MLRFLSKAKGAFSRRIERQGRMDGSQRAQSVQHFER